MKVDDRVKRERGRIDTFGQTRLTECCCSRGIECVFSIAIVSSGGGRENGRQGRGLMMRTDDRDKEGGNKIFYDGVPAQRC